MQREDRRTVGRCVPRAQSTRCHPNTAVRNDQTDPRTTRRESSMSALLLRLAEGSTEQWGQFADLLACEERRSSDHRRW